MSLRSDHIMSLAGIDYSSITKENLSELFQQLLASGMHGLCFSPYMNEQEPGSYISENQIRERIKMIQPFTQWIRTFSCTEGNEKIPAIAQENGLKVLAGAWLSDDKEINENEIENLIELAKNGHVNRVAVGNEVLYREELTEEELLEYIYRVKKELPNIDVAYVDAYYEFINRPKITEACDVIYANCYPFWEGCHIEYSLLYLKNMYYNTVQAAQGKKVIISETGWPNRGSKVEASEPSLLNAMKYFINVQKWVKQENIETFYFAAFDEIWKIRDEGNVGAFWGIWDKDGKLKY